MSNYVMVAAGQCGNQLCYELMSQIDQHLLTSMYHHEITSDVSYQQGMNKKKKSPSSKPATSSSSQQSVPAEPTHDQHLLYESFFRQSTSSTQSSPKSFARMVALDTEPKVIDDCVVRRKQAATPAELPLDPQLRNRKAPRKNHQSDSSFAAASQQSSYPPWRYDTKSIAFRHGGAGNNWSLGYSLAQGEFLETILDSIRRQLELADITPHLVFCHSLAGGTGSGLGTRVTECAVDEFPECLTTNIVVAPYHFGEVVVQHYNALLCLSKIQACSHSVILLENEMAQVLCKQMRGIDRPSLSDLNCVLANHITPLFLPKVSSRSPFATIRQFFSDDVLFLASHPAYRFLNVKLTPQTSKQSVDFTFDQWPALFKTIQRMQLSGAYSERNIAAHIKRLGLPFGVGGNLSQIAEDDTMSFQSSAHASYAAPIGHTARRHRASLDGSSESNSSSIRAGGGGSNSWQVTSPSQETLRQGGMIRSLGSVLSCHGESAAAYVSDTVLDQLHHQQQNRNNLPVEVLLYNNQKNHSRGRSGHMEDDYRTSLSTPPHSHRSNHSVMSSSDIISTTNNTQTNSDQQPPLFDEYLAAHHPLITQSTSGATMDHNSHAIRCNHSSFYLHTYQRSAHVVANDQSMLPILRRATMKSEQMFRTGAYLHQYAMYGVETTDFMQAFYDIGSVIQNYEHL